MHVRLAVITTVFCVASYGCATPAEQPAGNANEASAPAATPRPIRTGSRLPSYEDQGGSSSVGDQSKGDFEDQMRRSTGGTSGR
jgi:hypothetical protein